jgi:hypothetical protein
MGGFVRLKDQLAGAVLALVAAGAALAYWLVIPDSPSMRLPVVEGCSLHLQPCRSDLPGGGHMTFEISPKNAIATDVLYLDARFSGIEPAAVGVRFEGVNMDMGQLEYLTHELARIESDGPTIGFAGRGGVFACSAGVMHWLVLVRVQAGDSVYEVPYRFQTANAFG